MDEATAKDLQKLADLRASGAITAEQYDRLVEPVLAKAKGNVPVASSGQGTPAGAPQGASMLKVAAAAGGGALAGVLAADLLRNALADPPPEVLEASFVETTVMTDDGFVTQGQFTVENGAGEVVAEGDYVDQVTYADDVSPGEESSADTFDDAGYDSGPADFGEF